jgi:Protein of unknown function (DUF707).
MSTQVINCPEIGEQPIKQLHRNLVIVRAGDSSLHEQWLAGPEDRNWDIVVSYFGSDPERYRQGDVTRIDGRGPKWPALYELVLAHRDEILGYDFVWFPDDDLAADTKTINTMFSMCAQLNLQLAQPALTLDSYFTHVITLVNKAFKVRFTNFVEIMAPVLSRSFLNQCATTFAENMSGYGLDTLWPTWCKESNKIAILDACTIKHTRPVGGPNYEAIRARGGRTANEELSDAVNKYGLAGYEQRIVGGIDIQGRRLSEDQCDGKLVETILAGYLPELAGNVVPLLRLLRPTLRKMSASVRAHKLAESSPTIDQLVARLMDEQKRDEALRLIETAMMAGETCELWNDWATVHWTCGDGNRAEQGFRRALELNGFRREPAVNFSMLLFSQGRFQEALPVFESISDTLTQQEKAAFTALVERHQGGVVTGVSCGPSTGAQLHQSAPSPESAGATQIPINLLINGVTSAIEYGTLGKTVHQRTEPGWSYNLQKVADIHAAYDSATYYSTHMLACHHAQDDLELLRFAVASAAGKDMRQCYAVKQLPGLVLEFGVAKGRSVNYLGELLSDQKVFGFDWFGGLPETWRVGLEKGAFAQPVPQLRENVQLVQGLFEDVLPAFIQDRPEPISLLHVDCDLYSSTVTVFKHLASQIIPGTIIVFDEYFNYPGWRLHEFKAFQEFVESSGKKYEYLGLVPTFQQVCVRIAE